MSADSQAWSSSGRSRFVPSNGSLASPVSEKMSSMFDQSRKSSLPMYKDKPYAYPNSQRPIAWLRRKRVLAAIGLSVLALFYYLGSFSSFYRTSTGRRTGEKSKSKSKSSITGLFSNKIGIEDWDSRQEAVRQAMQDSWAGYEKYAWGYDEYHPISKKGRQMVGDGMGWIIVDALDTLMLMNLTTELAHAREWIGATLNYDVAHDVNTFETTIRMLGGLLSAHYLSTEFPSMAPVHDKLSDDLYLEKAVDLADRLMGAYNTTSGVPYASVKLKDGKGIPSHDDGGASSTAEATSLQLEIFPKMDHLVCFMPGTIALGATLGRTLDVASAHPSWGARQDREMALAKELMKTCWGMYKIAQTGLAPEITHFNLREPPTMMKDFSSFPLDALPHSPDTFDPAPAAPWRSDFVVKSADVHNLQRPETVESLFYMWRITGDETYREWGWEMFESFAKYTKVEGDAGFSSINNVNQIPVQWRDNMESFWLAETLKYFYLLFGPNDILPLDKVVYNTEAHPFPRFELGKLFKTGWKRKPRDKDGNIIAKRTATEKAKDVQSKPTPDQKAVLRTPESASVDATTKEKALTR